MRTDHLKIKIKSLAAEAAIIRHAERKARRRVDWVKAHGSDNDLFDARYARESLSDHRRGVVRSEARHSLLAYGFLRGRAYSSMETVTHTPPDWARVKDLVGRFGGDKAGLRFSNELKVWATDQSKTAQPIPTRAP